MPHSTRGWTVYTSTGAPWGNGVNFSLKCDGITATNNGSAYTITAPIQNYWPLHHSDLRAGYGRDAGGAKDSCIATNTGTQVATLGGTWQDIFGNSFTTVGIRQERFRVANLK
jgi:hypothetical protein